MLGWLALALLAGGVGLWLGDRAIDRAAGGRLYTRAEQVPTQRVAIVLGALVTQDGRLSDTLVDRVDCAVDLYVAGKVSKIIVSGDHGRRRYDEVNAMADALLKRGVAPADVFLDHAGFRTLDSMHRAHDVFGVDRAVVCTQRFHLPRALFLARHFGIDAVGLVADRRVYLTARYNQVREVGARLAALMDVLVGRGARLLGESVSLEGDGRATRDGRAENDPPR